MNKEKIRNLQLIEKDNQETSPESDVISAGIFLRSESTRTDRPFFCLGETHHGIEIDASEQILADLIFELRSNPCAEESLRTSVRPFKKPVKAVGSLTKSPIALTRPLT